jgi:hypothetical protein
MCFKRYKPKNYKHKKRIYPSTPAKEFKIDEKILCHGCFKHKNLYETKIHCLNCNQFYCCKIAGTCYGNKCNNISKLSLCVNCVPKIPINIEKNDRYEECICKLCFHN